MVRRVILCHIEAGAAHIVGGKLRRILVGLRYCRDDGSSKSEAGSQAAAHEAQGRLGRATALLCGGGGLLEEPRRLTAAKGWRPSLSPLLSPSRCEVSASLCSVCASRAEGVRAPGRASAYHACNVEVLLAAGNNADLVDALCRPRRPVRLDRLSVVAAEGRWGCKRGRECVGGYASRAARVRGERERKKNGLALSCPFSFSFYLSFSFSPLPI